MTKEELDKQLESWVAASIKGSGKRYYSKLHPELDDELEYTIRRATIVGGKPVSHEKKFLTSSLSGQAAKKAGNDLHKLTVLLDKFDAEYQAILDEKVTKSSMNNQM
jgi:hypothetical protein